MAAILPSKAGRLKSRTWGISTALVRPWWVSRTAPQGRLRDCFASSRSWTAVETHEGRDLHEGAGGEICPVRDRDGERLADEAHALDGEPLRERVEHVARERFEAAGEGVRPDRRVEGSGQSRRLSSRSQDHAGSAPSRGGRSSA